MKRIAMLFLVVGLSTSAALFADNADETNKEETKTEEVQQDTNATDNATQATSTEDAARE